MIRFEAYATKDGFTFRVDDVYARDEADALRRLRSIYGDVAGKLTVVRP